jgi:hypothetical protein
VEPFEVTLSTIARWRDGRIIEEYLMYDNASFIQQIGVAERDAVNVAIAR